MVAAAMASKSADLAVCTAVRATNIAWLIKHGWPSRGMDVEDGQAAVRSRLRRIGTAMAFSTASGVTPSQPACWSNSASSSSGTPRPAADAMTAHIVLLRLPSRASREASSGAVPVAAIAMSGAGADRVRLPSADRMAARCCVARLEQIRVNPPVARRHLRDSGLSLQARAARRRPV